MNKSLVWTGRALEEYHKILDYLTEEWGKEITKRVGLEIEEKVYHIQEYPYHYPVFIKRKNIRRCIASPQTSIYYKIFPDRIEIMSLFDNRQSPKKRKL